LGGPLKTIAAILALVSLPVMAAERPVGSVLQEFGLLNGSWAPDCSKGPSPTNWYGRYQVLPTNEARLTFSAKRLDIVDLFYVIREARRYSDNEILIGVDVVRENRQLEVLLRVVGDRYHTESVKRPNGDYQIKDGKYTDDGTDSPWYNRCR
jgi:hypothetical protein